MTVGVVRIPEIWKVEEYLVIIITLLSVKQREEAMVTPRDLV